MFKPPLVSAVSVAFPPTSRLPRREGTGTPSRGSRLAALHLGDTKPSSRWNFKLRCVKYSCHHYVVQEQTCVSVCALYRGRCRTVPVHGAFLWRAAFYPIIQV